MCSLDATDRNKRDFGYGRYLNHSQVRPNLKPVRLIDSASKPHIIFIALCDIDKDSELLFDYNDHVNKDITWLAT
jgi:SET domain-containing protein